MSFASCFDFFLSFPQPPVDPGSQVKELAELAERQGGCVDDVFTLKPRPNHHDRVSGTIDLQFSYLPFLTANDESARLYECNDAEEAERLQRVMVRAVVQQAERENMKFVWGPKDYAPLFEGYEACFLLTDVSVAACSCAITLFSSLTKSVVMISSPSLFVPWKCWITWPPPTASPRSKNVCLKLLILC